MKRKYLIILLTIILISCTKEKGCTDPTAINYNSQAEENNGSCKYNLEINFTHTVDNSPLELNQMIYTNAAGEDYSVQTLKYLISNITLKGPGINDSIIYNVHFVNIIDSSTFIINIPNLPNKTYTEISFTMGLDSLNNQTELFINESFFPSFAWPDFLGGGYHYMQLEGDFITPFQGYATHTGPTNGNNYSFLVETNFEENILENNRIVINMEINNWYAPNIINFTINGIMDDELAQNQLRNNGNNVFSISLE